MKARFYTSLGFGLALAALPLAGGCTEETNALSNTSLGSTNAAPTPATIASNAPAETPPLGVATTEPAPVELEDVDTVVPVPAPAPAEEKKLPVNIKPSGATAELIKLAQAGVDEAVMLNYITNQGSQFVLSSDDIIYLSDLGVAGNIVTAMLQHDQGLKAAGWSQASQPPPPVTQAAAPEYVNPPQPEPQPQIQPPPAEPAPAPTTVVTDSYFSNTLSPYGTWVNVVGYGRCWQPTVVVANPGWRPYCDRGRWVYSDCGWYWLSDYSWGATTFHYGRWFCHPNWGWCWWPNTVWSPAWVSWRYSSAYCGWAPLPPAACYQPGFGFSYYGSSVGVNFSFGLGASSFTFVSWNHVNDSHPEHHRVPAHYTKQIYHETTVVNNYGIGKDNTVVHRGIPVSQVREHTRGEVRAVSIREQKGTYPGPRADRGERLERDGRTLTVNRPRFAEQADTTGKLPRTSAIAAATPRIIGSSETEAGRGYHRPNPTALSPTDVTPSTRIAPTTTLPDKATPPLTGVTGVNRYPTQPRGTMTHAENNHPTSSASTGPGAPSKSVVVIGRSDANPNRNPSADVQRRVPPTRTEPSPNANAPHTTQNWSTQKAPTPPPQYAAPQRTQPSPTPPAYTRPVAPTVRAAQPENRYPPQPGYVPPRQSTPAPVYAAPPRQMAPVSGPAPQVTPSAPQPAPAPAYTPPSRSQNVESRPAPANSSSGGKGRAN